MARKVILTDIAQEKLNNLFLFLVENWSQKVKSDFIISLDEKIELIKINPKIYPSSRTDNGLHRCVISKHNSMYYRYTSDEIIIITIFDTRQHPNKLADDLR